MQTNTKSSTSFLKNKTVLATLAIAGMALAGGATYALWPTDRDAQVAAVAAQIANKSPDEARKIIEGSNIPREVAWEAFGQAREAEMQKRMDDYFALNKPLDRQKYLDKMIDEMQARQREWQQRAATRPANPDRERRRDGERGPTSQPSEERRKETQQRAAARQDSTPPAQRAQRVEFMVAMRKRMQERGIQGGGPGGFGGFGRGPGGPGGGRDGGGRGPG